MRVNTSRMFSPDDVTAAAAAAEKNAVRAMQCGCDDDV